jgi:hypothetical protein
LQDQHLGKQLEEWNNKKLKLRNSLEGKGIMDLNENRVNGVASLERWIAATSSSPQVVSGGCLWMPAVHLCVKKCPWSSQVLVYRRLAAASICSDCGWSCAGLEFKKLISEINDTVQDFPPELKHRTASVLTVTPTPYQLASIAFIETVRFHVVRRDL